MRQARRTKRKSTVIARRCKRRHAKERAWQRFSLKLSTGDLIDMEEEILTGGPELFQYYRPNDREKNPALCVPMYFKGTRFIAVYDLKYCCIVTIY